MTRLLCVQLHIAFHTLTLFKILAVCLCLAMFYGGVLDCVRDQCHIRRNAASKWQEVLAVHSVSFAFTFNTAISKSLLVTVLQIYVATLLSGLETGTSMAD